MMNIHVIIGPINTGKTTLIKNEYPSDDWIRIQPGIILRDSLGSELIRKLPEPNSPPQLDLWVYRIVYGGLMTAQELNNRSVVLDGFPRAVRQVDWFQEITPRIFGERPLVTIKVLSHSKVKSTTPLDRARMAQSLNDTRDVLERFQSWRNPRIHISRYNTIPPRSANNAP